MTIIIVAWLLTVLHSQVISNSSHSVVTNVDFPTQNSSSGFVSSNEVLANISIPGDKLLDASGSEPFIVCLHDYLTTTVLFLIPLLPSFLYKMAFSSILFLFISGSVSVTSLLFSDLHALLPSVFK